MRSLHPQPLATTLLRRVIPLWMGLSLLAQVGTANAQVELGATIFPAPAAAIATPVTITPTTLSVAAPSSEDKGLNLGSDVFGAQLFSGAFARSGPTQFNPDYLIATGDSLQVRLWGAFTYDAVLTVDPQGNIFLPHAGPVPVRGTRNADLQKLVDSSIRKVFRANVNSYASLAAAQPVRVFVGGSVRRPGLYNGTSMDSLLQYLDQAGGIDADRGSFLNVQVKRGSTVRGTHNLYDFLLDGRMPLQQLADGDVVFVQPRQSTVKVSGMASTPQRFEFTGPGITVAGLSRLAKPSSQATHVRIVRNTGAIRNVEYVPIADASNMTLGNGDEIEFTADKKPGTISVRVEGEHASAQEYVLPYGSRLGDLLKRIEFNERSDTTSVQLYRKSVKERQRQLLATSLHSLENSLLTARSGSNDEAVLRKQEADLTLQWVERAKRIEPLGQVLIAQARQRDDLLLENGDVLRVPVKDGLVLISGEVLFPTAVASSKDMGLSDYIARAGGYAQSADTSRIVIARSDGSFEQTSTDISSRSPDVRSGDQILVLPKVDEKNRQFWKEMVQIIYQVAVTAKIALGL